MMRIMIGSYRVRWIDIRYEKLCPIWVHTLPRWEVKRRRKNRRRIPAKCKAHKKDVIILWTAVSSCSRLLAPHSSIVIPYDRPTTSCVQFRYNNTMRLRYAACTLYFPCRRQRARWDWVSNCFGWIMTNLRLLLDINNMSWLNSMVCARSSIKK